MRLVAADRADGVRRSLVLGRLVIPRPSVMVLGPILVAALLAKLAISEGGRDAETLTLVQSLIFLAAAALVAAGRVPRTAMTWPMVAMMAVIAASVLWSVRPDSSLRVLTQWGAYVSIYAVTAATLTSQTAARRFVDAMVVIAGWLSLIALYLYWGSGNPSIRWYSTFYWPNPFATFLLLVLPLEAIRCLRANDARDALAHGAMTILLAVPFVLTYSRGGWLSLAAVVPLFVLVLRPKSWVSAVQRFAAMTALIVVAVVVLSKGTAVPFSAQSVVGRAVSLTDPGDYSIQGRLHFARGGLEIARDHPLGGTGAGTFAYVFAQYQRDVRYYARDAHSLYIQTASEMGVLGVLALAALLVALAAMWLRTLRKADRMGEYSLIAGVGVGAAVFFVHSGLEMSWSFPANPAMAFALLGVLAWHDRDLVRPPTPVRPARWWRWAVAAVLLVAVLAAQLTQAAQREFLQGKQLSMRGAWTEAAIRFKKATRLIPVDPIYPSALADAFQRVTPRRSEESLDLIRRAITLDRMNAYYPLQLARVLASEWPLAASTRAEAITLLEQALRLDPFHYPEGYQMLARLHSEAGNPAAAEDVYRRVRARYPRGLTEDVILQLRLWPGVARLHMDWAALLVSNRRTEDAVSVLELVIAEDAGYVPAYLALADAHMRRGDRQHAERVLQRGLAEDPANETLWLRWQLLHNGPRSIYAR